MTRKSSAWLLRAYPRGFRQRYGDELHDLLAVSDWPARDSLDLLVHACRSRLEPPVPSDSRAARIARALHLAFVVLAAISLVAFGYALNDVAGGLTEVPEHWWSTLAALVAGASVTAALLTRRWRRPAA